MSQLAALLLPPFIALLLSIHLGFAWGRLMLPAVLQPFRALLGVALLITITAAITTTTRLTPPQIALGLAIIAAPLNVWALHRTKNRARRTGIESTSLYTVPCALFVFFLAILPPLRWGVAAPIGSNWDAAEFYVPLGRMLQFSSQRDLATLPSNPLVQIATTPPVSGRIHAFSYLHAINASASGVDSLQSYPAIMAFVVALQPLAVYVLARVTSLGQRAALLATLLVSLGWLPLWVAYNNFSNHVLALPLLPLALAGSIVALRDDSWRGLLTGGLLVAALAIAYYPALTMYVAIVAPVALNLLWRSSMRRRLIARLAALAGLAFVLSAPAQGAFLFREGFLSEMLQRNTGFQVDEFVGLADMLGLHATFNRESQDGGALVLPGVTAAVALIALALVSRRYAVLNAMLFGAIAYLAINRAQSYHYGFYKGATFTVPLLALMIAAGAERLMRLLRRRVSQPLAVALASAVIMLVLSLPAGTIWRMQDRYRAAGPQLWTAGELRESLITAELPPGESIALEPPPDRPPTFNSLLSYRLLGRVVYGAFGTGFARYANPASHVVPDSALLPPGRDPSVYGMAGDGVIAATGDLRLYRRDPALRAQRLFDVGETPVIAPGESLRLRVTPDAITLADEQAPPHSVDESLSLGLTLGSFGPAVLELRNAGLDQRYESQGGLIEFETGRLMLPAEIDLRNAGPTPLYLRRATVHDATTHRAITPLTDALIQVLPAKPSGATVATAINVHTEALPAARQKLTALLTVTHNDSEVGRWVFWPRGDQPLRLELNLESLAATLRTGDQPPDLPGEALSGGDGAYLATLLFANSAEIVYATDLWRWQIRDGAAVEIVADSVPFAVAALPRPGTTLDATSGDGALRLRGYTLPERIWRPADRVTLDLFWQGLRRIEGNYAARVTLRGGAVIVAEATQAIGAADHGTSTWQEGEVARQTFEQALPESIAADEVTLAVELLDPSGRVVALGAHDTLILTTLKVDQQP